MNYIRHLNAVLKKFTQDERLKPVHISLYMALFQIWNYSRFENPIFISRNELMKSAKIGSFNTYHKCLRELSEYQYIQYYASHSPVEGSKVHVYNFDTTTEQDVLQANIKMHTSSDTTSLYKHTKTKKQREVRAPAEEEINDFFRSQNWPQLESSKFFHHYQANGWLIGGRTAIKDWQAAARKWMLNATTFRTVSKSLATKIDKDYGEPL